MTFGHGNFDHFGAEVIFHAVTGGEGYGGGGVNYALITKSGNSWIVTYSPTKSGSNPQNFSTHADAKSYAMQYEPTGKVIDASGGPVNAEMGPWSAFSEWDETDCELSRTKTRYIRYPAFNGGTTQDTSLTEKKAASPEDAVTSDWSEWSECAGGMKTRTKTITTPAKCGGVTPDASELTEDGICCSDSNATENADGSCACNEGYSMNVDGDCIEDPATDTDTTTGTTITAQSTSVAVAPASGMSGVTKGLLVALVVGGLVLSQK
jgi:hypothetical protein